MCEIREDLQQYRRPKNGLLESYIKDRLQKSLKQYQKDLQASETYLSNKNEFNIARKLNKSED